MTTVLLTGFEPFAGSAVNPSRDAVQLVAAEWPGVETLVTAVLPVTFAGAAERMRELIAEHSPDIVIAAGLAAGRAEISIERVAVNLIDARVPDNDGAQPVDAECVPGGPAARFSSLPVKAIAQDIADAGIRSSLSTTAGTFVCNHVFYGITDAASGRPGMRAGFIHVPWGETGGPEDEPTLPLSDIARALSIAVRTAVDTQDDITVAGGSLH